MRCTGACWRPRPLEPDASKLTSVIFFGVDVASIFLENEVFAELVMDVELSESCKGIALRTCWFLSVLTVPVQKIKINMPY